MAYYNPNNLYPVTYQNPYQAGGYSSIPQPQPQQSYTPQTQLKAMEWVEGEVGAKAFQMPAGWPANQPIPLWDTTDTVIWLKSMNPMGMPNPMQKLRYEMPEQTQQMSMLSESSNYATKDDLKSLREEILGLKDAILNRRNQNGPQPKGGNGNA